MDRPTDAFRALAHAIQDEPKLAREVLQHMQSDDVDELIDAVDRLAKWIDEMTIEQGGRW